MKYVLLSFITISGCGIPEQGVEDVADCSMTDALGNGGESNGIKVHLEPEKTTYLVGEPVMFRVVLKNNTRKDIQAWVEALQNQVQIFLSDGKRFNRFEDGMQLAIKVLPSTEKIKPNGTKIYQFKVLYTASPKEPEKGKLAFPKPGTYCIQAKYPLFPDRKMFESNLAHITVKKPAGDDAKIWQKINRPSVLRFLQSGHSGEDEEDMPVERNRSQLGAANLRLVWT